MDTLLGTARRGHPGLFWTAVAMTALAVAFLVLAVVDQRELVGAPLWFKPLKFAISIAAYTATLAWMLGRLPAPALQRTGWAMVAGLWIEILIIGGQAARGQLSHFNDDGGTGSLLFAIMGASITVVFFLNAAVAVRFLRERSIEADLAVAVRIGLLVTLVGMSLGFLLTASGGHTVGLPDGGAGAAAGRLEHRRRRPADRALRRVARAAGAAAARRGAGPLRAHPGRAHPGAHAAGGRPGLPRADRAADGAGPARAAAAGAGRRDSRAAGVARHRNRARTARREPAPGRADRGAGDGPGAAVLPGVPAGRTVLGADDLGARLVGHAADDRLTADRRAVGAGLRAAGAPAAGDVAARGDRPDAGRGEPPCSAARSGRRPAGRTSSPSTCSSGAGCTWTPGSAGCTRC